MRGDGGCCGGCGTSTDLTTSKMVARSAAASRSGSSSGAASSSMRPIGGSSTRAPSGDIRTIGMVCARTMFSARSTATKWQAPASSAFAALQVVACQPPCKAPRRSSR